jgi:hypothetical protein
MTATELKDSVIHDTNPDSTKKKKPKVLAFIEEKETKNSKVDRPTDCTLFILFVDPEAE